MNVTDSLTANPSFRAATDRTPDPSVFKALFDEVCEELADAWPDELTYKFLREHHPDLYEADRAAYRATEQAWRRRDLAGFREHLGEFRTAVRQEIEAFTAWEQR